MEVALVNGRGVAHVDAEDFYRVLAAGPWRLLRHKSGRCYAIAHAKDKKGTVHMHRLVSAAPAGLEVDHKDLDGLNNQKANLRFATLAENQHNRPAYKNNTSGFKGVSFRKKLNKWQAYISLGGKKKHLGFHNTPEQAHAAYCRASEELHGVFGRTV